MQGSWACEWLEVEKSQECLPKWVNFTVLCLKTERPRTPCRPAPDASQHLDCLCISSCTLWVCDWLLPEPTPAPVWDQKFKTATVVSCNKILYFKGTYLKLQAGMGDVCPLWCMQPKTFWIKLLFAAKLAITKLWLQVRGLTLRQPQGRDCPTTPRSDLKLQ